MKLQSYINGKGEKLLFLGGAFTNISYYKSFLDELSKCFKVYSFNYPGFSKSEKLKTHTLYNYLQTVDDFVVTNNLKNFYISGASFGGLLATKYAKTYSSKIKGLILFCPMTRLRSKSYIGNYKAMLKTVINADKVKRPKINESIFNPLNLLDTKEKLRHARFVIRQNLTPSDMPDDIKILLVVGENDLLVNNDYTLRLFDKENVRKVIFKSGGHIAHTLNLEKTVNVVRSFINSGK